MRGAVSSAFSPTVAFASWVKLPNARPAENALLAPPDSLAADCDTAAEVALILTSAASRRLATAIEPVACTTLPLPITASAV